ncbi:MAG: extracellular solute-binding protein [Pseudolabrys sp.]|nr:extracellular solute-binding protein [Pseudolabrys sp.]
MANTGKITRRALLQAGAAAPLAGLAAPAILAQGTTKSPTKVLDFTTTADVAKAEQEGQLVFYCHENEAGTAGIMEGFRKDFPKINTSYVRAQTGALYNKILSERQAGKFECDVLQLSDLAPAFDFQKKGGYELHVSPESDGYKKDNLSAPNGYFFWTGVDPAGIAYNSEKVAAGDAPKGWKDILDPRWKGKISCKISASGLQFVQWYALRKLYGDSFWKEFAKLQPHAFDSRVQLFDRLAKGDDTITSIGEYPAYILFKSRGAKVEFVAPPDGLVATPLVVGAVNKAPHPEASKLFVDWAMSKRGQAWYQTNPNLYYGSVRTDAPPMPTGVKLSDFKLLYPADWDEYAAQQATFLKEWNGMLGL